MGQIRNLLRDGLFKKLLPVAASVFLIAGEAAAGEANGPSISNNGLVEISVGDALVIPAWSQLTTLIDRDLAELETCRTTGDCSSTHVVAFVAFLSSAADLPQSQQLEAVNDYFNLMPYRTDDSIFGVEDLWQSPLSFAAGSGDCEDYAIAKYAALRVLGFAEQDMRLVVLMDTSRSIPHAVLEVNSGGHDMVLDNLSDDVEIGMDEDYRPIYALNTEDHWIFLPASDPAQNAPASGDRDSNF